MTIRDIPRFGERLRMIEEAWLREEGRALPVPALYGQGFTLGIVAGVEWASEQADREPSDAEVEAGAKALWDMRRDHEDDPPWGDRELHAKFEEYCRTEARAVLLAAQEVRRG